MCLTAVLRTEGGEAVGIEVLASKVFQGYREGFAGKAEVLIDGGRYQARFR